MKSLGIWCAVESLNGGVGAEQDCLNRGHVILSGADVR